ncbi:MAG: type II toxin-antitoxin system RelE/ParE family toxin [bacterium]|nr:type II toxin-antitoxin system RelE/ParE family toxin [bacterium]
MEICFFDDSIKKFVASLEKLTIAKILRTLDLLEKFGRNLGLPHSKKVSKNLFELRVRGKQEIRIFYAFSGSNIVLFHIFIKKSRKIPKKEINIALKKLKQLDLI